MAAAAAGAAAVVARARRRLIEGLKGQGAISPESAAPVATPRAIDQRMLSRLLRDGLVVQDGPQRYHLDMPRLAEAEATRRRMARMVLIFATAVAVIGLGAAVLIALLHLG